MIFIANNESVSNCGSLPNPIHNYIQFTYSRIFFRNSHKPDFLGNRGNFRNISGKNSKIGEICTKSGEKGNFTYSSKKQG